MNLRNRIAKLEQAAETKRQASRPLCVLCVHVKDDHEHRPPGEYFDGPGLTPTIIFDGTDPPPELLRKWETPDASGFAPLIIVQHID